MRQKDAIPDIVEVAGDVPSKHDLYSTLSGEPLTESGSPTNDLNRSEPRSHVRRKSTLTNAGGGNGGRGGGLDAEEEEQEEEDGFGDDFDDFEEGEEGAGDDFGDFDDGLEEPSFDQEPTPSSVPAFVPSPYVSC